MLRTQHSIQLSMPPSTGQPQNGIFTISVTLTSDLLTPKTYQFIYMSQGTSNESPQKIHQCKLEVSRKETPKMVFFCTFGHAVTPNFDLLTHNPSSSSLMQDALLAKVR